MPIIRIRGHGVDVDVKSELEQFPWQNARYSDDKIIASSPFRYDRSPSFFVSLDGQYAGCWKDSGAYDQEWESGGLVKLLSFLRDETYEETEETLLSEYGKEWEYGEKLELPKLSLKMKVDRHLDSSIMEQYKFRHPYLGKRGISEEVQRSMRIGYCKKSQAVTIPWFGPDGRLANIKRRKVNSKIFWYEKGAVPIRNLVYGMNVIYRNKTDEAIVCEAEVDAMTWMSVGKDAVSVGGANFTDYQADIIRRSPIKKLYVCADNDKAGEKLRKVMESKLRGFVELRHIQVPSPYKDVNEAYSDGFPVESLLQGSEPARSLVL